MYELSVTRDDTVTGTQAKPGTISYIFSAIKWMGRLVQVILEEYQFDPKSP